MPFKSQAQRRKFGELVKQDKMSQSTFDEWNKATGKTKLPERITPKKHTSIESVKAYAKKKHGV